MNNTKKIIFAVVFVVIAGFLYRFDFVENEVEIDDNLRSQATVDIYFLNKTKFARGTEPYEEKVVRSLVTVVGTDLYGYVMLRLFDGPTSAEAENGLAVEYSGATGATVSIDVITGLARVDLVGGCDSKGASYTIANLINKNLLQFPEVKVVHIYDPSGSTETPEDITSNSIPSCLEP